MIRAVLALLLGLLTAVAAVAAAEFPPLGGRVVDAAELLPEAAEAALAEQLAAHEQATSNQVVVATVASLGGVDIAAYANRLFRHWQLGQKGRDNGVLLLVAPAERQVRIEVGYGLEGALTDAAAYHIIQQRILPAFRDGDFVGGVTAGVTAVLAALDGTWEPLPERSAPAWVPILPFLVVVAAMVVLSRYRRSRRRPWRRSGLAGLPLVLGHPRGGRGGHADGVGSAGGFGGGGGSSGGGGASGGW